MVNYQEGKIYKLVIGELTYVGSTTQPLHKRFHEHKSKYARSLLGQQRSATTSIKLFEKETDDIKVDIVLIEKYSCEDKYELHKRERYWIETLECVNKMTPTKSRKEWCQDNKQKIAEKAKKYNLDNKQRLAEQKKKYYQENIDKKKEYDKIYYQENIYKKKEYDKIYRERKKDEILEKKKQYYYETAKKRRQQKVICECGLELMRGSLTLHKKTKSHQNNLLKQTKTDAPI